MTSQRKIEITRRVAGVRFRRHQEDFVRRFDALLAPSGTFEFVERVEAALLASEFDAALTAAEDGATPFVTRTWTETEGLALLRTLSRIADHIDESACWLITSNLEPLATSLDGKPAVTNLRAVAEWAEGQVRLFDNQRANGAWLGMHSNHFGGSITYAWELEVFGKVWAPIAASVFALE